MQGEIPMQRVVMTIFIPSCFFVIFLHQILVRSHVHGGEGVRASGVHCCSSPYYHVKVKDLIQSTTPCACPTPTKGSQKAANLELLHRYGPCFNSTYGITLAQRLSQNKRRLRHLQSLRASSTPSKKPCSLLAPMSHRTIIPAQPSLPFNTTGIYVVKVGFGTPPQYVTLSMDTGSDLTWTQCKPCEGQCYKQKEPIFDPRMSRTYANVGCNTTFCKDLSANPFYRGGCSKKNNNTCTFSIVYYEDSHVFGDYAKESLSLTLFDIHNDFRFGCGNNNSLDSGEEAGIFGLGLDDDSFVSQSAKEYGQVFAYCFPSSSCYSGYLQFGKSYVSFPNIKFTPMFQYPEFATFQLLHLTGISVAGQKLPINQTFFSHNKMIMDSGSTYTSLPLEAYTLLRSSFRKHMTGYPMSHRVSAGALDVTCYNLSQYDTVRLPKISLFFEKNVEVAIHASGILDGDSTQKLCLAFEVYEDLNIIGNTQMRTIHIVHDIPGKRIGFAPSGCF